MEWNGGVDYWSATPTNIEFAMASSILKKAGKSH